MITPKGTGMLCQKTFIYKFVFLIKLTQSSMSEKNLTFYFITDKWSTNNRKLLPTLTLLNACEPTIYHTDFIH